MVTKNLENRKYEALWGTAKYNENEDVLQHSPGNVSTLREQFYYQQTEVLCLEVTRVALG